MPETVADAITVEVGELDILSTTAVLAVAGRVASGVKEAVTAALRLVVDAMARVAVFEYEAVGVELDVTVPELDEEAVGVGVGEDVIDIVTLSV